MSSIEKLMGREAFTEKTMLLWILPLYIFILVAWLTRSKFFGIAAIIAIVVWFTLMTISYHFFKKAMDERLMEAKK